MTNSKVTNEGGIFYVSKMGGQMKIHSNTGAGLTSKFSIFQASGSSTVAKGSMLFASHASFNLYIIDSIVECTTAKSDTLAS